MRVLWCGGVVMFWAGKVVCECCEWFVVVMRGGSEVCVECMCFVMSVCEVNDNCAGKVFVI